MVDQALILRKVADLEKYLLQIREFQNISIAEYSNDWKTQRIVERTLQIMIETCTDVATHIISDQKYRVPDTYADIFKVLSEENLLGRELTERLIRMVQFRNIVVHDYKKVDPEVIVGILKKHLADFTYFKDAVITFVKKPT